MEMMGISVRERQRQRVREDNGGRTAAWLKKAA